MSAIPRFYLFGEPPRDVDEHFLHLETIADRSAPLMGHIRPHMHADLNHILCVTDGSGEVLSEGEIMAFAAPCLIVVPAGCVHGFQFSPDISGYVLTVASAYLNEVFRTRPDLQRPVPLPRIISIKERRTRHDIQRWIARLGHELRWHAPAQRVAIEASLLGLMCDIERLMRRDSDSAPAPVSPAQGLLARFRDLIERQFKSDWNLDDYLNHLRATEPQLRYACQKSGEASPMQVLWRRRLIEAKRLLLYSNLSVAECGFQSGFKDPAYFSRLFHKQVGQSPRAFRQDRRGA